MVEGNQPEIQNMLAVALDWHLRATVRTSKFSFNNDCSEAVKCIITSYYLELDWYNIPT